MVFEAQKHRYTKGSTRPIDFDPLQFLACNLLYFCRTGTITRNPSSRIPEQIDFIFNTHKYTVFKKHISDKLKENLTDLYIHGRMHGHEFQYGKFDSTAYYSQHNEKIAMHSSTSNNNTAALIFYLEVGFWLDIDLQHVDGLAYIASYPEFICSVGVNSDQALLHYFNNFTPPLMFSPQCYVASNWDKLKYMRNENGCISISKVCRHYITEGYHLNLNLKSFDHWAYLANNPKYIIRLLNGEYQISLLNASDVANIFIKKNGKNSLSFNEANFVKMYVTDREINYDKKLNLENAAEYFVRGFVQSDKVRWRLTKQFKTLVFLRHRIADGVRQVPVHILKFFLCARIG